MINRIPVSGLDLIRFFAALFVITYHLGYRVFASEKYHLHLATGLPAEFPPWGWMTWWGWIGVQIFFVISGLVIAYSASDAAPARFFVGRLTRLVPTMLVAASLVAFVEYAYFDRPPGNTLYLWAKSIVFSPIGPWISGQIWTLPIEIFFYTIIYFLILWRKIDRIEMFGALLGVASGIYWLTVGPFGAADPFRRITQLLLLQHGCYFSLGILLSRLDRGRLTPTRLGICAMCIATAALQIQATSSGEAPGFDLGRQWGVPYTIWLASMLALMLSIVLKDEIGSRIVRRASLLRFIGLLTYPLYLVHMHVGGPIIVWLIQRGASQAISLGLACLGSIAVAGVIAAWLEPPLRAMLSLAIKRGVPPLRRLASRFTNSPRPARI